MRKSGLIWQMLKTAFAKHSVKPAYEKLIQELANNAY